MLGTSSGRIDGRSRVRMRAPVRAAAACVAGMAALAGRADVPDEARYLVRFHDFAGAERAVVAAGGRVALELAPQKSIAAYLPDAALQGLENNPNVAYVEPDPPRFAQGQHEPYGISMVQADDPAFAVADASSGSTVCVIDSGYQRSHEDLQDSGVTGSNDPGTGNWYQDACGHGTHVAGTLAALDNAVGVVGVNGSGRLRLHVEKVFDFDGYRCSWAYSSSLIAALNRCQAAVTDPAQKLVVNMSLGGPVPSVTEEAAFDAAYEAGALPVAAAGNAGDTSITYPAGYASVVSVAAVDSSGAVASFSQRNADVELAAPGVGVVSTTPFRSPSLSVDGDKWIGANLAGSARTDASGVLADGGLCLGAGSWAGRVVLCQRGTNTLAEKVAHVQAGGGTAAAIYNDVSGGVSESLGAISSLPAIGLSLEDGLAARARVGAAATLVNSEGPGDGYEAYNGTSMATPHVAGVAALVWSLNPSRSNAEVRDALRRTALDLGKAGRDNSYGHGLVRAKAAHDYLQGQSVAVELTGVTLKSSVVAGCKNVVGTAMLSGPAPVGGLVLTLADTLAAASVPATMTVAEGASVRNFTVRTSAVASPESGDVSVTLGGTTLSQGLTVRPMGVSAVSLTPNPVIGGASVNGLAKLECKAGPGPILVTLSSTGPGVASPTSPSLQVPVGVQSVPFVVTTTPVAARTRPAIKAVANAVTKSKVLTVDPPAL